MGKAKVLMLGNSRMTFKKLVVKLDASHDFCRIIFWDRKHPRKTKVASRSIFMTDFEAYN